MSDPLADPPERRAKRTLTIEVGLKTMLVASAVLALIGLLFHLWTILLVVVVALMLVGMMNPPIAFLERHRFRRPLAIAIVVLGVFAPFAGIAVFLVPQLVSQAGDMLKQLPGAQELLADWLTQHHATSFAQTVRNARVSELATQGTKGLFSHSMEVIEAVALGVSAIFLALYLLIDRDTLRGASFAIIPRRYHVRLSRVLLKLETIVGGYLRGQVITSAMMALFTGGVLALFHVPHALFLATLAGLADVLPYIGAILATGPAVLAALHLGLPSALGVLLILAAYQEFESRIIVPRVYGKTLRLPAAAVMLSLLVGGKLLGIIGALLALPIAAGIRMIIEELRLELPGDQRDTSSIDDLDERSERVFAQRSAGASAETAAAIATELAEERIKIDEAAIAEKEAQEKAADPS